MASGLFNWLHIGIINRNTVNQSVDTIEKKQIDKQIRVAKLEAETEAYT